MSRLTTKQRRARRNRRLAVRRENVFRALTGSAPAFYFSPPSPEFVHAAESFIATYFRAHA